MPAMSRINARLIAMRGQMHLFGAMENAAAVKQLAHIMLPSQIRTNAPSVFPCASKFKISARYDDGEPVVRDVDCRI